MLFFSCHLLGRKFGCNPPEAHAITSRTATHITEPPTSNYIRLEPSLDTSPLSSKPARLQSRVRQGHIAAEGMRYLKNFKSSKPNAEAEEMTINFDRATCPVHRYWLEYPEDQHVGVRYFIRILVVDRKGRIFWNTQEVRVLRVLPPCRRKSLQDIDLTDILESEDDMYYTVYTV
jgi:hypothetical protein